MDDDDEDNDFDNDCDCDEDDCDICGDDCDEGEFYDITVHNWYWKTWSWLGGGYPEFDDKHWKHFPKSLRKEMRMKYEAGHHQRIKTIMKADYECSESLSDLRDEYNEAIRQFRVAVTNEDVTKEEKRTLMHRMMELERELSQEIREAHH